MLLLDLPSELLLCIAEKLHSLRDMNAFTRANRRLSMLLDPYLYLCDVQDNENWAISWAILHGKYATAVKHLKARKYAKCLSALEKPLFEAIRNGHESIVELLLATGGIDPNSEELPDGRPSHLRYRRERKK
jgi:ankyrin repeat protein